MAGEPPTHRHTPPTRRLMVVAARDRTNAWRRVVNLLVLRFLPWGRLRNNALNGEFAN